MTSSLQPHDLRGRIPAATPTPTQLAIRAGLDVAEQLATAHQSLRRIDTVLRLMRDTYVQSGDTRAVSLIDTILAQVVGPELPGDAS